MVSGSSRLCRSLAPQTQVSHFTLVFAGMNQQGDSSFMAAGSSPPRNMIQGRMGGPPQNAMMPGMQGNPQGGHMYQSGDMKGWPQGGMPRNKCVSPLYYSLYILGTFPNTNVSVCSCSPALILSNSSPSRAIRASLDP